MDSCSGLILPYHQPGITHFSSWVKCFACIISVSSHNMRIMSWKLVVFPFFTWRDWVSEMLINLLSVCTTWTWQSRDLNLGLLDFENCYESLCFRWSQTFYSVYSHYLPHYRTYWPIWIRKLLLESVYSIPSWVARKSSPAVSLTPGPERSQLLPPSPSTYPGGCR